MAQQFGDWSDTVSAEFTGSDPVVPAKVTGVTMEPHSNSFRVSWNAVDGAVGYQVELKRVSDALDGTAMTSLYDTTLDWSSGDNSLPNFIPGVTYHCRVRAYNNS